MSGKEGSEKPDSNDNATRLDETLAGAQLGPAWDKKEYEALVRNLPAEEQELATENGRFADLWQYFGEHSIELPAEVVAEVAELAQLSAKDKLETMRRLNKTLMGYLNDVGEDSGIRQ